MISQPKQRRSQTSARRLEVLLPRRLPRRAGGGEWWLLGAVIAVAAVLRLVDLGGVGLNSDEAVYAGQAASLAGNPRFTNLFPVVRAHPLLLQMLTSPFYASGAGDVVGRYVAALFGVGTVGLVFALGRVVYNRRAGVLGAALIAVMPYHVAISRQMLLDGPETFFATAAAVCVAVTARTGDRRWMVAAGGCLGLAALTKETAVVLIASILVFLAVTHRFWTPWRPVVFALGAVIGLTVSYPLVTVLAGGSGRGGSYLLWQLSRRPNHTLGFYPSTIPPAMGLAVVAVAAVGLIQFRSRLSWREALLVCWAAVPFVFFEVWPVKGFSYLMPAAPAVAVLAGGTLDRWLQSASGSPVIRVMSWAVVAAITAASAVPAVRGVARPAFSGLAGAGGVPGGREAARWIDTHLPRDVQFMTVGPSMANLVQFYSGRQADGLSVSPNPLHRNPSYFPISNADAALRAGRYQYVVWDAYSAGRSATFGAKALELVRRFDGRVVHVEMAASASGAIRPVVVIYQLGTTRPAGATDVGTKPRVSSPAAPSVPERPVVVQPNALVIYIGYSTALAGVVPGVVILAVRQRRRFGRLQARGEELR